MLQDYKFTKLENEVLENCRKQLLVQINNLGFDFTWINEVINRTTEF